MTIASQTSRISYTGNGSTTAFSIPFFFTANSDIVVSVQTTAGVVTTKTLGTDYTLAGAGVSTGGTCTFVTAPTTGYIIAIYRVPTITQTTSYNNNDPFPAKSHEAALDKTAMIDQYLKGLLDRAILVAPTDTPPMTTLPAASVRALKTFSFDAGGNPSATTPIAAGTTVSSAMIPVVTSSTLALARSALGLGTWSAVNLSTGLATLSTSMALVGDGATDQLAALQAYRDAVIADGSKTMILTAGTYVISGKLELGYAGLKVIALGKVTFKHTGTGVAISFDAGAAPSTATIFDIEFGWGNDIYVTGNANTTDLVFIRSCHHMKVGANVRNGTTAMRVNFSVLSNIRLTCSSNEGGFTTVPVNGLLTDIRNAGETVTDCVFTLIVEGVSGQGVDLTNCIGCDFRGTAEACAGGGLRVRSTSSRNTFTGFDCEANGLNTQDWNIEGDNNLFLHCIGAITTSTLPNIVSGNYNVFLGGYYNTMTVHAISSYNIFYGTKLIGTSTLDSVTAIYEGCSDLSSTQVGQDWRAFTPTITANTGTFTTVSGAGRYRRRGNTISGTMTITCTTVGTAAGFVKATIPVGVVKSATSCVGQEAGATGKGVTGVALAGATLFSIRFSSDGTFPGASGNTIVLSFEYEIV